MSANLHLEGQVTKKYNLPLSHLDFKYIENCKNVKEIEKIVTILRSGEEGKFPDLEKYAEKRLQELSPKSRQLRRDGPIMRPGDLSGGDWKQIEEDLKNWADTMQDQEPAKTHKSSRSANDIIEGDENIPPIRSGNITLDGKKQKKEEKPKKRVMPRDYREWDKVDVDAELEKMDAAETKKDSSNSKGKQLHITPQIDTTGLTEEEKERKANREKDKGNEAFRSHDFEESVTYYSRSISLLPNAASFNNRALAYLKLESWDKAIKDCNKVLSFEADNIKALLRRGTAHKSKKDFKKAVVDFEKVLKMEPNNKKAETLLNEAQKELEKEKMTRQKKGGRRMVIEEVESDDEEEVEEVEAEKPYVNGHSNHEETKDCKPDTGTPVHQEKIELDNSPEKPVLASEQPLSNESSQVSDSPNDTQAPCSSPDIISSPSTAASQVNEAGSSALSSVAENPSSLTSTSLKSLAAPTPSLDSEKHSSPTPSGNTASVPSGNEALSENHFTRPRYIQRSLPPNVQKFKEQGNQLFRSGQYGDAIQQYTNAIVKLEKDADQKVHLSVLLSNRAACHLKTGNCTEAVKDCHLSLQYVPHGLKSLLRRAAAYEAMERYADAYVDYKHAISIDKSADQAHQGASRCQRSLQTMYGPKTWREKMKPLVLVQPWEIPLIEDETGSKKSIPEKKPVAAESAQEPQAATTPASSQETASVTDKSKVAEPTTKAAVDFEEVKAKGNSFVQKGKYTEAIECYSTCISLKPDQVACYTNRALCFLKLDQAAEAASDCEKALQMEPKNPKALYRRALARKMCQQYKLSLQDLVELLKLEPKNTAAQKEMDAVKRVYKEELEKIKQKKVAEQETKVRKRMKIEEVDDDEEDEKPTRGKGTEKSKFQSKSRVSTAAKSKGSNGRTAGSTQSSSSHQAQESASTQDHSPMAPPIAPRLMKTTPYEFCQAWNSLKPCQGVQPYADILRQISPSDLPAVISNKLDGQMLQIIVKCVHEEMVLKGENDRGYEILNNLCQVPRFSTVSMFMSSKEKKEVSSVLAILSKASSSAYNSADIARLKSNYSVK